MNNEQLAVAAGKLKKAATEINHPLLPATLKDSIVLAAFLVEELVRREVQKNGER